MSKKVQYPKDFSALEREKMGQEVYCVLALDGEDRYLNVYQDKVEAAETDERGPDDEFGEGVYVATYRLVKIEALKVLKETRLVEVK